MQKRVLPLERIPIDDSLELAPLEARDGERCYWACQDASIHRWIPLPIPYSRELADGWCGEAAEAYRLGELGIHFAVRSHGWLAGCISLKQPNWREGVIEIGYWVAPDVRRLGVASRAVRALSGYAFAQGFERIELRIAPGNEASMGVAVANGFVQEGTLRSAGVLHSGRTDLVVFSLLLSDAIH
jgi:RimJ/RimL family protein N-acetyltransferase